MNAKAVISDILKEKGTIKQVYWVACGGSLIDLYSAHCMIKAESNNVESSWYNSGEFLLTPPKKLGQNSLIIVCSHSGNTKASVDAAYLGKARGAAVVTLTDCKGSLCDVPEFAAWVYPWGENIPTAEIPSGITLLLAAELLKAQENFPKYDAVVAAIKAIDTILPAARKKVNAELSERFAALCKEHDFLYILGSGSTFSQTYGLAICSLMEMQWQHCCYIHSGEYFHGPFETTENGVFYFLQMGSGVCRPMDERALSFLKTHTDTLMVLDALDYGMDIIDIGVRDYLDPVLFYAMNVELRAARGKVFDHDVEMRRYMGVEQY